MPRWDGTGPRGRGPMTGKGRGYCAVPLPAAQPAPVGRPAESPEAPASLEARIVALERDMARMRAELERLYSELANK